MVRGRKGCSYSIVRYLVWIAVVGVAFVVAVVAVVVVVAAVVVAAAAVAAAADGDLIVIDVVEYFVVANGQSV